LAYAAKFYPPQAPQGLGGGGVKKMDTRQWLELTLTDLKSRGLLLGLIALIVLYGEIFSSFAECFAGNQMEFLQTLPVLPLMVNGHSVKLSLPGTSGHLFSLPSSFSPRKLAAGA